MNMGHRFSYIPIGNVKVSHSETIHTNAANILQGNVKCNSKTELLQTKR